MGFWKFLAVSLVFTIPTHVFGSAMRWSPVARVAAGFVVSFIGLTLFLIVDLLEKIAR